VTRSQKTKNLGFHFGDERPGDLGRRPATKPLPPGTARPKVATDGAGGIVMTSEDGALGVDGNRVASSGPAVTTPAQ
jgi:hypothetical protein